MMYDIKRNNVIVASVQAEGKETIRMMGEETVSMSFKLPELKVLEKDDEIVVFGKKYYLSTEPSVEKISTLEWAYSLSFVSEKYKLGDAQFFFYDSNNVLNVTEFDPITTASSLVDLLVQNINRVHSGWSKGIVDNTDSKQVSFSGDNCLTALNKISEAFDLEFWVEDDKSIHFTEKNNPSGYSFEYGEGNGLKGITRQVSPDSNILTRLYATGAEKNLPVNYRDGQKKLRMAVPNLEKNVNFFGLIERVENFEDIFPKRIGTVTAVDPINPLIFTDNTIDFDLNATDNNGSTTVLINNVSAKVIFQTGQLAGYTLEIQEYGYNTATKTFTLLKNQDEKTLEVPSDLIRPEIGDTYILEDIQMPSNYVADAEAELQTKAQEYIDENSRQKLQYTVISDPIYFKNQDIDISVGFTNHMVDSDFGLDDDIRVTATIKDLQNEYDVQFEMSESSAIPSIIKNYIEKEKQLSSIIKNNKFNKELARQSYYFAREMFNKTFDGEGYFETGNYKPLSIETKAISLGSPMQAFALPNISWYVENNGNDVSHTAGELVHFSINPNGTRTWTLVDELIQGISSNFNRIYIKAEKQGNTAIAVITEDEILVESDPDYYYFEAGVLSSVLDDYRQIKMTHGFGFINPAELSIGKISSPFGGSYIDILQDKIKIHADLELTDDSIAFEQINGQIYIGGENLLEQSGSLLDDYNFIADTTRYYGKELPYTYSVDALNTIAEDAVFVIVGKNASTNLYEVISQKVIPLSGVAERVHISFKIFLNSYKKIFSQLVRISDNSVVNTIKPKLEVGNRPTDYNQSQYDVNLKIAEVEKKTNFLTTSIYGNIVATGTVLLGNYETGTNAGITGEGTVDDVFLWAGSNYAGKEAAPIRFYRNGTGVLKNVTVEGEIIAESGWFGTGDVGFEIFDLGIKTKEGYIVCGDYTSAQKSFVQIVGTAVGSPLILIQNDVTSSAGKTGIYISVSGSSSSNVALQISNGEIRVKEDSTGTSYTAFTGTKIISGVSLKFVKGLLVQ